MPCDRSSVPPAGDHGGDGAAVAAALGLGIDAVVDLSASLNPFAPDVARLAAKRLDALRRYPDAASATAALAAAIGVATDRLVLTNGAADAITLVASIVGGGRLDEPEFSLYPRSGGDAAPLWRSNPNNPRGTLAPATAEAAVWDEAFWPLACGTWTRGDDRAWRIGSLTKLWACPGLRLGYVIAPDGAMAAQLAAIQPRWAVNGLAVALVPDLLDATDLHRWARDLGAVRHELAAALGRCGLRVTETSASWVLVSDVPDARARLATHGVLVRDCSNFGMPGVVRVSVPRPDDVDRVVAAFGCL